MDKGIKKEDLKKIKDKLDVQVKSETVTVNSIKEVFSNLNAYVDESHKEDLIVLQSDLIKVSNHFKKNHDSSIIILDKTIEKYENVVLQNIKVFNK